jgi:hypothetical protein
MFLIWFRVDRLEQTNMCDARESISLPSPSSHREISKLKGCSKYNVVHLILRPLSVLPHCSIDLLDLVFTEVNHELVGSNWNSSNGHSRVVRKERNRIQVVSHNTGVTVAGVPIGTNQFMIDFCKDKVKEIDATMRRIERVG